MTFSDTSQSPVVLAMASRLNAGVFASGNNEWETPAWLFDILDAQFGFYIDVAASDANAKCGRYFTVEDDALKHPWRKVAFCNPPYGRTIGLWMAKAHAEANLGSTVVCLVPARTDTRWWWDYCRHAEVRLLPGRLKFELNGQPLSSAPFPSAVVVFRPGQMQGHVIHWNPKEVV